MRLEKVALQRPLQSYEQQSRSRAVSHGKQQHYGPGMPGPEMGQRLSVAGAMSRYPLSTETLSMRPQPPKQQFGYTVSGTSCRATLCPVVPATPIPFLWPEQSTQYENATPPQRTGPMPGRAHLPAQAANDDESECQTILDPTIYPSLSSHDRYPQMRCPPRPLNLNFNGKAKG